jgi:ribosomal subunit interface protein
MKVTVAGKQVNVGDALRTHVEDRISATSSKYFSSPIESHIVFSKDGSSFRADCSVHVGAGIFVTAHAVGEDAYATFDTAAERIEKQLRRYKRRLRDHHRNEVDSAPAQSYVLAAESEDETEPEGDNPVIVAESITHIPTVSVSEAVMRMDLANTPVLMFRNSSNGGLSVVYRRDDGNIGWIDPSTAD